MAKNWKTLQHITIPMNLDMHSWLYSIKEIDPKYSLGNIILECLKVGLREADKWPNRMLPEALSGECRVGFDAPTVYAEDWERRARVCGRSLSGWLRSVLVLSWRKGGFAQLEPERPDGDGVSVVRICGEQEAPYLATLEVRIGGISVRGAKLESVETTESGIALTLVTFPGRMGGLEVGTRDREVALRINSMAASAWNVEGRIQASSWVSREMKRLRAKASSAEAISGETPHSSPQQPPEPTPVAETPPPEPQVSPSVILLESVASAEPEECAVVALCESLIAADESDDGAETVVWTSAEDRDGEAECAVVALDSQEAAEEPEGESVVVVDSIPAEEPEEAPETVEPVADAEPASPRPKPRKAASKAEPAAPTAIEAPPSASAATAEPPEAPPAVVVPEETPAARRQLSDGDTRCLGIGCAWQRRCLRWLDRGGGDEATPLVETLGCGGDCSWQEEP